MSTTPATNAMTNHSSNDHDDSFESIQRLHQLQARLDDLDQLGAEMHKYLDRLVLVHLKPKVTTPTQTLLRHAQIFLRHSPPTFKRPPTKRWEDAEITHMKSRLSRLIAQRQETAAELSVIRASMSACRRIPPEIWSIIFQFCLPDDEPYVKPDARSAPLLLCSVSQRWRDIAVSTPSLWNALSIDRNGRKRRSNRLLESWLKRSGNLPLSISISFTSPLNSQFQRNWSAELLRMVLSFADRWERLHLSMADETLYQSILDAHLPNLHTVEFSNKCASGAIRISPATAPRLRTVSFLTAPLDPSPATLPWEQLHDLSSRYWTDVDSHLDVMARCPNLEHTRVHVLHANCAHELSTDPLRMGNLKSLEVVALNGNAMGLLLERLEVPLLEELTLVVPEESMEYGTSGWPKGTVLSLVERSKCNTIKVHLLGIDLSSTDDEETLRF